MGDMMEELFNKLNIVPKDINLYKTAFSHSSYVNEHKVKNDYERLEFVGDAVLVIWPPDGSPNFLKNACKRACQCAMDIINKLDKMEFIKAQINSIFDDLSVLESS